MKRACPACGTAMRDWSGGAWGCPDCGHEEVAFQAAHRFSPRRALGGGRRAPGRTGAGAQTRGGGAVATVALLLIAGGLAVGAYILIMEPEATSGILALVANPGASAGLGAEPEDYEPPVAQGGVFHREFEWTYGGRDYTWQMNLTEASYRHFRDLDRPVRRYQENGIWHVQAAYDMYVSNLEDDPFIDTLAKALLDQSRKDGMSDDEALSFTLAFVQSLTYSRDDVTTGFDEYPRFPVETLVDQGGDCEDTSILYASLVLAMGYGAIMVSPPGHMAVAVAAAEGVKGTAYNYQGQRYLYAETTGDDYGIGTIPDEYDGSTVSVYDLRPKPLFALDVQFGQVTRDGRQEILLTGRQTGSAVAHGVQLVATVGRADGQAYDEAKCEAGDVQPGAVVQCRVRLDLNKVPRGMRVTIRCIIQDELYVYDQTDSTPWVPRG